MSEVHHGDGDAKAWLPSGALGAWWGQGARAAFLKRPDWRGLIVSPAVLALLWITVSALGVGAERLMIDGPARFYWPTLMSSGWMTLVLWLLLSWCLAGPASAEGSRPGALALTAMLCAQALTTGLAIDLLLVPLARSGAYAEGAELLPLSRVLWSLGLLWEFSAQSLLLWRASLRPRRVRLLAVAALVAAGLTGQFTPLRHWYPERPTQTTEESEPSFKLTQELVEAQAQVLVRDLHALLPQRQGRIDVYTITYAPYADEDVFLRESELVVGTMQERFDGAGRTLQLVSRRDEVPEKAWATPLNLQRAVERVAELMNRDEDVLVLHLTSHGSRNGELASSLWPLEVQALTPARLKSMLDAVGVRYRVISVSSCYSGTWLAPLSAADTLVMTATDAEHTSFGCGRGSELTYFGRAMFAEQLRQTRSFEQAHVAARGVIAQREKDAGKNDGFSNPQIAVGNGIREKLARLERQLATP